jgi:membrane-associated phospholipid phosphatase
VSRRSAALLAAVFATLAALVAAGAFTRLDQWSIDHLMPGGSFRHKPESLINGLVPLLHSGWGSGYAIAVNIVTLPASFVIALVIVALCSRALGLALIAAVGVEVICKELLTRPALYKGSLHIAAFDSSFPSGHTLRTLLVAAAVSLRWPRARPFAIVWALASLVLILLAGWHTPSDLAGGVVLAGLALLGARSAGALRRRRLPRSA